MYEDKKRECAKRVREIAEQRMKAAFIQGVKRALRDASRMQRREGYEMTMKVISECLDNCELSL